ncbi:MAG: RNA-binding S4 domain-containing protein [Bacteroidales bacterium]
MENSTPRADKWLWSVRIYKTRSDAAEACKNGRIKIADIIVKASRSLNIGDIIVVRKSPINYTFKILAFPPSRVSAKLVDQYCENLTTQSELDKLDINKNSAFAYREKGLGRPTKRERRKIDEALNNIN